MLGAGKAGENRGRSFDGVPQKNCVKHCRRIDNQWNKNRCLCKISNQNRRWI